MFSCTSTHATLLHVLLHFHTYIMLRCCTALPHTRHATLLHVLLPFHTYVMLPCCMFSCTATHTSCYAAALHFHTHVMLRCCTFSCASTHTSCYPAACSLALPHIRHATVLHVLLHLHTSCHAAALHFHTHVRHATLLHCTFSCTSTHTSSCYGLQHMLRCCAVWRKQAGAEVFEKLGQLAVDV